MSTIKLGSEKVKMERTDKQLVKLIRTEPDRGIAECIDRYGGGVKAICYNILRDSYRDYADDAMMESFTSLWQFIQSGKKINTTLEAYLYGIARKKSLEMLRKNSRHTGNISIDGTEGIEQVLIAENADVENIFARKHNEKLLHEVIAEMDEPDRKIFLLRYFYFYKVREVAEYLSLTEDYVENRLRRGRQKLKKSLEKRGILYEKEN